jgi:AAA domain (dynein-related subfamily).
MYVDSPAVRAVKHGRLLILEGIEKAERGIMPVCVSISSPHVIQHNYLQVLNNLLENREM